MIIYIYDSKTGEYLKEYSPQPNPKRKGEYIYPPNSSFIKPETREGFVSVYDGTKWTYVLDLRGEEIINPETDEKTVMKTFGELPDGFILYKDFILTDEYKEKVLQAEKETERQGILSQIDDLDRKRIRAICEPETREDGKTWLEFYTEQIIELRNRLKEV